MDGNGRYWYHRPGLYGRPVPPLLPLCRGDQVILKQIELQNLHALPSPNAEGIHKSTALNPPAVVNARDAVALLSTGQVELFAGRPSATVRSFDASAESGFSAEFFVPLEDIVFLRRGGEHASEYTHSVAREIRVPPHSRYLRQYVPPWMRAHHAHAVAAQEPSSSSSSSKPRPPHLGRTSLANNRLQRAVARMDRCDLPLPRVRAQRGEMCAICLDDLCVSSKNDDGVHQAVRLPCLHSFHEQCVAEWLHAENNPGTCPVCRLDFGGKACVEGGDAAVQRGLRYRPEELHAMSTKELKNVLVLANIAVSSDQVFVEKRDLVEFIIEEGRSGRNIALQIIV